jgi:autotransporter passenger strand-loop-strand repeat protein
MSLSYSGTAHGDQVVQSTVPDGDADSDAFDVAVSDPLQFNLTINPDLSVSGTGTSDATITITDGDADDPSVLPLGPHDTPISGTTSSISASWNEGSTHISFGGFVTSDRTTIVGTEVVDINLPAVGFQVTERIPVVLTLPVASTGATVASGQTVYIPFGSTASNITVQSGGTLLCNGTATNVINDGQMTVDPGGSATGTVVRSGGQLVVDFAGDTTSTTLAFGGQATALNNDGTVAISVSGDGFPLGGAFQFEMHEFTQSLQAIQGGHVGVPPVHAPATADDGTDSSQVVASPAGTVDIYSGGVAVGVEIDSGGMVTVHSGGIASGMTVSTGGEEVVTSGGTVSATTIAGGVLNLGSGATVDGVTFQGGGGELILPTSVAPGTIAGLAAGDVIQLEEVARSALVNGNTLTVTGADSSVLTYQLGNPNPDMRFAVAVGPHILGIPRFTNLNVTSLQTLTNDFTGGGISDLLWRNSSGEVDTWLMTNGRLTGGSAIGNVSTAWQFAGTGDFTGNGTSDAAWQNTVTGEVDSWLFTNGQVTGGTAIGHAASVWQPLGTGDFNADGVSDLLWRNGNTGEVDTWLMNNGQLVGGTVLGTVSSAWQFAGVGDFTGTGTGDVLWHNTTTGEVDTWIITNGHLSGGTAIGSASSAWQALGTGDFNGDGTSDILWRNTSTGEVDTWIVNNGQVTGGAALGSVSSAWQFAGTGEYTGNGTSDILWRNTATGEVDTWLIGNDQLTGGAAISTASTAWQPQVIHTG